MIKTNLIIISIEIQQFNSANDYMNNYISNKFIIIEFIIVENIIIYDISIVQQRLLITINAFSII